MSFDVTRLGINANARELNSKKEPKEAKVANTLEEAIDIANQDAGDEAIVEVEENGQKQYVVVDIKKGSAAASVFDPDAGLNLTQTLITRHDKQIEVIPHNREFEAKFLHTSRLAQVALNDQASGLDSGGAYNLRADKLPAYQANLTTVLSEVEGVYQDLQSQVQTLESANPRDEATLAKTKGRLQEMTTFRTILQAKLLILPVSNQGIPGTDLKVGQYRKTQRDRDKAETMVREQLGTLQGQYSQETDATRKASLKKQIDQLQTAATGMDKSSLQIEAAALSMRVRVGALATMNNLLVDSHDSLETDIKALGDLYKQLHDDPKGALANGADDKIKALEAKINRERKALVQALKEELKTFKEHAPTLGGKLQKGAAETVSLLEAQIKKIEALGDVNQANYSQHGEDLLQCIDETQVAFEAKLLENKQLEGIQEAAKFWDGISPQEASAVADIVDNTEKYTQGYAKAKEELKAVKEKQTIAHKVEEFQAGLYSLNEDPTMADAIVDVAVRTKDGPLRAQLLAALSSTPISDSQMEAYGTEYQTLMKSLFENAEEGTKLYELKQAYSAMHLSKTDEWKDRVDLEKLQAKIEALSKEPEIQAAFAKVEADAIQKTFGDRSAAASKLENYILSDDFQRRYKLLSSADQKALIQGELQKLTLLAPDRVTDVAKKLMMKNFEAHGAEAYTALSPQEGASGFESFVKSSKKFSKFANGVGQFSKVMDKALREVAMSPGEKSPDAVIKALERLKKSYPSAGQAIEFMSEWKNSGKLGSLDGLFAGIALVAKGMPTDAVSALDSSTSLFSLMSKGEDFAKFFGMTDEALKGSKFLGPGLKAFKWLGPAADFIGAGLDFYKMADEIKHGDTWGAVGKGVSGTGGLMAGAAGVAILAGASGPAAPIVLVGGIVVGLIGWAIDSGAGESPEETLLRELGVLKPKPEPEYKPPTDYERHQMNPYYMHPGKI